MRDYTGTIRLALSLAALLGALALVIHRQSNALGVLRELDELRHTRALAEAERAELVREIQRLESRAHIVAAARERLGMRVPSANEIVILPLNTRTITATKTLAAASGTAGGAQP